MQPQSFFRKEALIRNYQPEASDDLLRVTAPRERVFTLAFLLVLLALAGLAALAA